RHGKYAAAEPFLREYLDLAGKHQQSAFHIGHMKTLMGDILAGKKQYADAETFLLTGYQEMLGGRAAVSARVAANRKVQTVRSRVKLYEAWDRPEEAARWRAELPPAKRPKK